MSAETIELNGTCGDNFTWELTSDGTLTISGMGEMTDYKAPYDYNDYVRPEAPWFSSNNSATALIVEEGVTSIGRNAFYYFHSLESVSLPSTLKTIHTNAFFHGLTLPDGLETLEPLAFGDCTYLDWISLPESLVNVSSDAFRGCYNISSVYYGENLDQWQALDIRFDKNAHIYPQCATPDDPVGICLRTCGDIDWLFVDRVLQITGTWYMPAFSTNISSTLPPWPKEGLTSVVIGSGIYSVGSNAFAYYEYLVDVTLSDTVLNIMAGAFNWCDSLQRINLSAGIISIEESAFGVCKALTDVYYGGSKTEWQAISIEKGGNTYLLNTTIHCIDGDIKGDGTPVDPVTPIIPDSFIAFYPENGKIMDLDNPTNGTSSESYADNKLRIFFDKELANSGSNLTTLDFSVGTLEIHKADDDSVVYAVKAVTDLPFCGESVPYNKAVRLENATLALDYDTKYYVTMPAEFIKFVDGTVSSAIEKGDWTFAMAEKKESIEIPPLVKDGKFALHL